MLNRRTIIAGALSAAMALGVSSASADNHEPSVLTVTMNGDQRTFSQSQLEALGTVTFETTTIWTDGLQSFTGTPLSALVAELGITEGVLLASAVNDYTIEFPVEDALLDGPIVAFLRNGVPMSVRNKGPLWIVYPYDSDPAFQTEVVYSRSIWQMNRLALQD